MTGTCWGSPGCRHNDTERGCLKGVYVNVYHGRADLQKLAPIVGTGFTSATMIPDFGCSFYEPVWPVPKPQS